MAGPQRIEWRRCAPRRALGNLQWYSIIAVLTVACTWLLFAGEPARLDSGSPNPLTVVPTVVTVIALVGAGVFTVPVVRRPLVAADHYALLVRPGFGLTRALPWVHVAEVAVLTVGAQRYLLVRCRRDIRGPAPRLGWLDQIVLRRVRRQAPRERCDRYDLAVGMRDFVGGVESQIAVLAAFAPDTVTFTGESVR